MLVYHVLITGPVLVKTMACMWVGILSLFYENARSDRRGAALEGLVGKRIFSPKPKHVPRDARHGARNPLVYNVTNRLRPSTQAWSVVSNAPLIPRLEVPMTTMFTEVMVKLTLFCFFGLDS